jgi:hypothetical protein
MDGIFTVLALTNDKVSPRSNTDVTAFAWNISSKISGEYFWISWMLFGILISPLKLFYIALVFLSIPFRIPALPFIIA